MVITLISMEKYIKWFSNNQLVYLNWWTWISKHNKPLQYVDNGPLYSYVDISLKEKLLSFDVFILMLKAPHLQHSMQSTGMSIKLSSNLDTSLFDA